MTSLPNEHKTRGKNVPGLVNKKHYGKEYFTSHKISKYGNYFELQNSRSYKDLLNFILLYKTAGNLLEIGCAYGFLLRHTEKYFNSYGIDISSYAIKRARKISPKSELTVGNIETRIKKYPNNFFDVIIAIDVLEHLEKPSVLLTEIYRKLKNKGIFIFRVPNKSSLIYYFFKVFRIEEKWFGNQDKTHISLFTVDVWNKIIKENNFKGWVYSAVPTYYMRNFLNMIKIKKIFYKNLFIPFNLNVIFLCKKIVL